MPEEHEQMEEKLQRKFFFNATVIQFTYILIPYRAVLAESQFAGGEFFGEDG